jgi:hypothetical protein
LTISTSIGWADTKIKAGFSLVIYAVLLNHHFVFCHLSSLLTYALGTLCCRTAESLGRPRKRQFGKLSPRRHKLSGLPTHDHLPDSKNGMMKHPHQRISAILEPFAIQSILTYLGLPDKPPELGPAQIPSAPTS